MKNFKQIALGCMLIALTTTFVAAAPVTTRNLTPTSGGLDQTLTINGGDGYFYGFNVVPTATSVNLDGVSGGTVGDFHTLNQPTFDTVNGTASNNAGGAEALLRTDFTGSIWRAQFLGVNQAWTSETRVTVNDEAGEDYEFGIFHGSDGGRLQFFIGAGGTDIDASFDAQYQGLDHTGVAHTWRVASTDTDGADREFWVYRDGVLLNSVAITNGSGWDRHFIGDFSGGIYGSFEMEYHSLDKSGAYAPVPEPATMSLLALGGIAMLRRRKK